MSSAFSFAILRADPSGARLGSLSTPHGTIETPAFIFCATRATLKGLTAEQVIRCGAKMLLANTYHLALRPGADTVETLGGLHSMMGWSGPLLTDSGGFQIFSLGHGGVAREIKSQRRGIGRPTLLKITEEGALFRSYVDGSTHLLTAESSIQIQRKLGADIVLPLDECTPFHADRAYTAHSTRRSHRWERRSLEEFRREDMGHQALYGIIQGGIYGDLRRESCDFVGGEDFFGQAIGGSLGGSCEQMREIVSLVGQLKHASRPTHLLGIGGVRDIFHGIRQGIDTFDCVHPTRLARHGGALLPHSLSEGRGHINLHNARFVRDSSPIDGDCPCHSCRTASRGYIHHLLKSGESLGGQLITIHNVTFMARLMENIRKAIREGTLESLETFYLA